MSTQYHSILGLPGSGKTTFLAALWHVIDAGEVATKLVLDKMVGDYAYLNTIVDAWRRCQEVPRTSMAAETNITIHIHAPATGQKAILGFPDLSGESFKLQFAMRSCTDEYIKGFDGNGGILLFVNANRPSDGMTLADIGTATVDATEVHANDSEVEWTADAVPEQVRIVDLLQFLLRPPFLRRQRRLAVVVSAWDTVLEPKPTPERWLCRELPLLHQFLANNTESFTARIYGISAQGGDVAGEQRATLLGYTPSERIECVGLEVDPHDITAPIMWLTGED